ERQLAVLVDVEFLERLHSVLQELLARDLAFLLGVDVVEPLRQRHRSRSAGRRLLPRGGIRRGVLLSTRGGRSSRSSGSCGSSGRRRSRRGGRLGRLGGSVGWAVGGPTLGRGCLSDGWKGHEGGGDKNRTEEALHRR